MPPDARIVIPGTDIRCLELVAASGRSAITFSVDGTPADVMAHDISFGRHETSFAVRIDGVEYGSFTWTLAGVHNIANALAALAAITPMDVSASAAALALSNFAGANRRFDVVGDVENIAVIDDYAHHPTEVKATIDACRSRYGSGRLWVFFEPHTFSRTQALLRDLGAALAGADVVLVSEIVGAREQAEDFAIRSQDIVSRLPESTLHYLVDADAAERMLVENAEPGDTILCMSVTGSNSLAGRVADGLAQRFHS
jgi:UDP-N-acetylmuramate--alanine ligase